MTRTAGTFLSPARPLAAAEPSSACLWIDPDVLDPDVPADQRADYAERASWLLWAATGRGLGVCSATIQPRWASLRDGRPAVRLEPGPVVSVDAVVENGVLVPLDVYVLAGDWLLRLDDQPWIVTRATDLYSPALLEVAYSWGRRPGLAGEQAAQDLAVQLYQLDAGQASCHLPKQTTSVTRQGVTWTLGQLVGNAKTGIPSIDSFVLSVNPRGVVEPTLVYSPDTRPRPRRTA